MKIFLNYFLITVLNLLLSVNLFAGNPVPTKPVTPPAAQPSGPLGSDNLVEWGTKEQFTKNATAETNAEVINCSGSNAISPASYDIAQCPKILEKFADPSKVYCKLYPSALFKDLITEANKRVAAPLLAVRDQDHNYKSFSPYYWPTCGKNCGSAAACKAPLMTHTSCANCTPANPTGSPYIKIDGCRNDEQVNLGDEDTFKNLAESVVLLTKAYQKSNDKNYINATAKYLTNWFIDPKTKMNPNLDYAQMAIGELDKNGQAVTGHPAGMVEFRFIKNILEQEAIMYAAQSPNWDKAKHDALVAWVNDFYIWLTTSKIALKEKAAYNNHGVWYDIELGSVLLFLGKTDEAKTLFENAKQARIDSQICSNGVMPREEGRADKLLYRSFNLEAFCTLAELSKKANVDLYSYQPSATDRGGIKNVLQRQYKLPAPSDSIGNCVKK